MATFRDQSGTSQDRFLVVFFRTQSEKTETETETGLIKTDLAVRSFAVQFRLKTGLQSVFGPDSWTLMMGMSLLIRKKMNFVIQCMQTKASCRFNCGT